MDRAAELDPHMPADAFSFQVVARCGRARAGRAVTPHGAFDTPVFMPVGTRAAVKGLTPDQLRETRSQVLLANTYHLLLRPGAEVVESLGGLSRFMSWPGPTLTDSGGYQVFSLAELRQVDDEGVRFRSHIDGADVHLSPESSIRIQNQLGADMIMAFDECPPLPAEPAVLREAVERTVQWAARSRAAHARPQQALYGIVQGGLDLALRRECLARLLEIGFDGYALGGLSVGEPPEQMWELVEAFADELPADRPRYLMGVGTPRDLVEAVRCGIDQFDCVLPTRNGRKGYAFTSLGVRRLRNAVHRLSDQPLDPACACAACRGFSCGYLRHLLMTGEVLGGILISLHNICFYQALMIAMRSAVCADAFDTWYREFLRGPWAARIEDEA